MTTSSNQDDVDLHALIDGQRLQRGRARPASANPLEDDAEAQAYVAQRNHLSAYADMALAAPQEPAIADHLFAALSRRVQRRRILAWGGRACVGAALVSVGFAAGVFLPHISAVGQPSYAVAVSGSHLILDSGSLQAVRRVEDAKSRLQADNLVSDWLRRPAHAPVIQGYHLAEVSLMRADRLPVAGLLYKNSGGRALTVSLSPDPDGLPDPYFTFVSNGRKASYWSDGRDSVGVLEDRL